MGREFGQQAGAESPEGMGMIELDVELFGQLAVDGLDDLAHCIEQTAVRLGQLTPLIAAGQGQQTHVSITSWQSCRTCQMFVPVESQINIDYTVSLQSILGTAIAKRFSIVAPNLLTRLCPTESEPRQSTIWAMLQETQQSP
jgi:hypothetical protein